MYIARFVITNEIIRLYGLPIKIMSYTRDINSQIDQEMRYIQVAIELGTVLYKELPLIERIDKIGYDIFRVLGRKIDTENIPWARIAHPIPQEEHYYTFPISNSLDHIYQEMDQGIFDYFMGYEVEICRRMQAIKFHLGPGQTFDDYLLFKYCAKEYLIDLITIDINRRAENIFIPVTSIYTRYHPEYQKMIRRSILRTPLPYFYIIDNMNPMEIDNSISIGSLGAYTSW